MQATITHTLRAENFPHRRNAFPPCVYIKFANGDIVLSCNFIRRYKPLEVYVYTKEKAQWVHTYMKNAYTEKLWGYYNEKFPQEKVKRRIDYKQLMKHERAKKKGGAGKMSHDQTVTDYECTNNPLHDFRRSMCVQWNNGI